MAEKIVTIAIIDDGVDFDKLCIQGSEITFVQSEYAVINKLRDDVLFDRESMRAYCRTQPQCQIYAPYGEQWRFRILTRDYALYLRCIPTPGDYNFYVFCYDKEMLMNKLAKDRGLPRYCYAYLPTTKEEIRVDFAERGYASVPLLLHQVIEYAVRGVEIVVDIALVDVVEEVEIKVGRPALAELLLEDLLHAFKHGIFEGFDSHDDQYNGEGEIISRETIEHSIDNGVAYRIRMDGAIVGGLVLKIKLRKKAIAMIDFKSDSDSPTLTSMT